jgi:hypothetical protein
LALFDFGSFNSKSFDLKKLATARKIETPLEGFDAEAQKPYEQP